MLKAGPLPNLIKIFQGFELLCTLYVGSRPLVYLTSIIRWCSAVYCVFEAEPLVYLTRNIQWCAAVNCVFEAEPLVHLSKNIRLCVLHCIMYWRQSPWLYLTKIIQGQSADVHALLCIVLCTMWWRQSHWCFWQRLSKGVSYGVMCVGGEPLVFLTKMIRGCELLCYVCWGQTLGVF